LVTRVSLDRKSSSAAEGKLFSQELIEAGAVFEGSIRNIPAAGVALLERVAAQRLFLGRGTSAGLGECELTLSPSRSLASLSERGATFGALLSRCLERAGLLADRVDRLVPMTLASPLLPLETDPDGSESLAMRLVGFRRWWLRARRFGIEGSWDQRSGNLQVAQTVAAGAVFVAELAEPWAGSVDRLIELEQRGAGQRTHQGFGHVLCFDPFIVEGTLNV
jgi:hypothetical protein